MKILAPEDRPVQILLADRSSWGSVTVNGAELPIRNVRIGVGTSASGETVVTLEIAARHCNIKFHHMKAYGEDDESSNPDL